MGKQKKKQTSYRDLIIGFGWILLVLLGIGIVVWLMMPAAGHRVVPRKYRFWQTSWVESPGSGIRIVANCEALPHPNHGAE